MNSTVTCIDKKHVSCAHAAIRKLVKVIDKAEAIEFQGSGLFVAVVGVRTDHWQQFVQTVDNAETYLASGVFSITRPNGDVIFVVPFDDLPNPKVLDIEELETLLGAITKGGN